jgi:hypothetical protein
MSPCEQCRENLSAYLDAELADEDAARIRRHVEACPACRGELDALRKTRRALAETFAETMANAPAPRVLHAPPPSTEATARRPRRRGRLIRLVTAVGIAAAVILALVLNLYHPPTAAAADELLKRAAERHLALDDAEFFVTLESQLAQMLGKLFNAKPKKITKPAYFRIVVKAPNRFLVHRVESVNSRKTKSGEVMGFDGRRGWKYDPEKGHVEVGRRGELTFKWGTGETKLKTDLAKEDLLGFLSWDFVKSLGESDENYRITEVTGPFDRRIRRRVFRLEPAPKEPKKDGKKQWVFARTVLTIDPSRNMIEKMVFDIDLSGLSILRVKLELAEINTGYEETDFGYRSYAPPGTPVVETKPDPDAADDPDARKETADESPRTQRRRL